jgi:BirA family biotin operon repressor/biotin-[acetyl-CoA-carboxylase] ligase
VELAWRLARRLGDGRFHSGQQLAEELGVTRSTVWNALQSLQDRGLEVFAVRGKGYRLPEPIDWLEADRILATLPAAVRRRIGDLEVLGETDSTNARLVSAAPPLPGQTRVCLAEYQTSGRGRRGRRWLSSLGTGVCLSLAWQFQQPDREISALGLIAGLNVRATLLAAGADDVMLKWPNDLVVGERKLGGILVEMRAEGNGPAHVVIGVGINHRLTAADFKRIESAGGLAATDLTQHRATGLPPRNELAGQLIAGLVDGLASFSAAGARGLTAAWRAADALEGQRIAVEMGGETLVGMAAGIDEDGALLLNQAGAVSRVTAGDVSVRRRE